MVTGSFSDGIFTTTEEGLQDYSLHISKSLHPKCFDKVSILKGNRNIFYISDISEPSINQTSVKSTDNLEILDFSDECKLSNYEKLDFSDECKLSNYEKLNEPIFRIKNGKTMLIQNSKKPVGAIYRKMIDTFWTYLNENNMLYSPELGNLVRFNKRYNQIFNYYSTKVNYEILDVKHRFLKMMYCRTFKYIWKDFETNYENQKKFLEENLWARQMFISFSLKFNKFKKIYNSKKYKWIIDSTPFFYFKELKIVKKEKTKKYNMVTGNEEIKNHKINHSFQASRYGVKHDTREFIKLFNGEPCQICIVNNDSLKQLKYLTNNQNIQIKSNMLNTMIYKTFNPGELLISKKYLNRSLKEVEDICFNNDNNSKFRMMRTTFSSDQLKRIIGHLKYNLEKAEFKKTSTIENYQLRLNRLSFMTI